MNKKARLAFTGDIMSNVSQNAACKTTDGYDYSAVFADVSMLLADSDCRIGNIETPFAGGACDFSCKDYSFNTPDEFASALQKAGFNVVSTANNHCLDRGVEGLFRTLDILDAYGIAHTGTARNGEERCRPLLLDLNGIMTAFISYTYGTNAFANHLFLKDDERFAVNLLQPQETLTGSVHLLDSPDVIEKNVAAEYGSDGNTLSTAAKPHIEQLSGDIRHARERGADFVFVLMHSGGQYNSVPESYTKRLVQYIVKAGADAIIGNHPHVVQNHEFINGIPVFYSLGNFTFTPGDSPSSRSNPISNTGVILKVELEKAKETTSIRALSFSVTRSIILPNGVSVVKPACVLMDETKDLEEKTNMANDMRTVVNRMLNKPLDNRLQISQTYVIPRETPARAPARMVLI